MSRPDEVLVIDARAITDLVKALRDGGSRSGRTLGPRMRRIGQSAADDARRRAGVWSERIPDAISVSVQTRGTRAGIRLRVRAKKAPHARAYEGLIKGGHRGFFRHPMFPRGDDSSGWRWRSQATRPFLLPAAQAHRDQVRDELAVLLQQIATSAGMRRTG